jgi:hypothetical protein
MRARRSDEALPINCRCMKNRLFVLKIFVDGGLAILNLLSHFAGGDRLPAFLGGDLACSGENALPDLLLFPLSALFDFLGTTCCTCRDSATSKTVVSELSAANYRLSTFRVVQLAFETDLFFFLDRLGARPTLGSDETLQPNFTDPKVILAVRTYLSVLRDFSPHQAFQGYRQGQPDDNGFSFFAQGHSGMFFGYGTAMDRPQGFTTAIAPPPVESSLLTANDAMPSSGLYISATTAHPAACWKWLKYLSSDLSILIDGFPARISLAESDDFSKRAPEGAREVYAAYRAAFTRGASASSTSEAFYDSAIDYYWFFSAVDQALQGKTLEPALDEAQTRTTQYLACVRVGSPAISARSRSTPTTRAGRTCHRSDEYRNTNADRRLAAVRNRSSALPCGPPRD